MHVLLEISIRSLAPAALAAVCLSRVKSASLKHAVWSLVMAGMLLQLFANPVLPPVLLRVLRPVERVAVPISMAAATAPLTSASAEPIRRQPDPLPVMPLLYCLGVVLFAARLLRAYWFTRGLLGRAESIGPRLFQSSEIAVPVTAGAKILLPRDWREWDAPKLRAVLAHEEAHVRRRDSLVTLVARVNRCVFWFHPLAWWLERELAQLAEQACDDAALTATQDREGYARTLLEMARAVHVSQGRLLTSAMAKEANVETRIDRVLDESRHIPKAMGRAAWALLAAGAGPLLYLAAAVQLAPAQTVMAIPAPAVPAPPVLLAQAPPPPQTPAVTAPAPAAAAPLVVAPQTAPEEQQKRIELERLQAEIQMRMLATENQLSNERRAQQELRLKRELEGQAQLSPEEARDRESQMQREMAELEYLLRVQAAQQEIQAQALPQLDDRQAGIAEAMAKLERLATQMRQTQSQNSNVQIAGSQISVDVAPERKVSISIPFDSSMQGEAIVSVTSTDGRNFNYGARNSITGSKWDLPLSLKPGFYHIQVLVRNPSGVTRTARQSDFEVK